jgi:hypothetical protein
MDVGWLRMYCNLSYQLVETFGKSYQIIVLDNLAKKECFYHESNEFVHMKQQILEVLPSIFLGIHLVGKKVMTCWL